MTISRLDGIITETNPALTEILDYSAAELTGRDVGELLHPLTMVRDVTDVHLLEQRLRHQSLHDLLTGLPNRNYLLIHLDAPGERAAPNTTLLLCKIDGASEPIPRAAPRSPRQWRSRPFRRCCTREWETVL